MQFTPQQLAGANRYNLCTRIGNWNEDLVLEESRMKDFRLRKQQGHLNTKRQQTKFSICNQPVPLSYSRDSYLRYGHYIMLMHCQSGGSLANDLWEETYPHSEEYCISICQSNEPIARNVFRIVPTTENQKLGEVVNYGDPFRLMCNESLRIDNDTETLQSMLFLKSVLKTDRSASPITSNQLVSMSNEVDADSIWYCVASSRTGTEQSLSKGLPIHIDESLSIAHQMTRQYLYADMKNTLINDFDNEYEVCCLTIRNPSKSHNLELEREGKLIPGASGRQALNLNSWKVILASSPTAGIDDRNLPPLSSANVVLVKLRESIVESVGFRYISLALNRLNSNGLLDREDIKWCFKDCKIPLRNDQFDALFDQLDKKKSGLISIKDFLVLLRGDLSHRREDLIGETFNRLEAINDGIVLLQDLCDRYKHVKSMQFISRTKEESFSKQWNTENTKGTIILEDFLEYYRDISAMVDDDASFEELVNKTWDLEG